MTLTAFEREVDCLERQRERAREEGDTEEMREIDRTIRDMDREESERERWREEGADRGWLPW